MDLLIFMSLSIDFFRNAISILFSAKILYFFQLLLKYEIVLIGLFFYRQTIYGPERVLLYIMHQQYEILNRRKRELPYALIPTKKNE